jgi:predicted Zn-dependent protease
MTDSAFYRLGRHFGPKVRKARWMWESMTGTEADAIRLERHVGRDLANEARSQLAMDPDPRSRELLTRVGERLSCCVANRLRSFHFDAFQSGPPNAFALPGGFIFVGRSLMELCGWDEDEIAFILGHEMAHIIRGHVMERIVANSALSALSRTSVLRGAMGGWLRTVGVRVLETAYSRDQESEADRLGVRLLTAAEFQPRGSLRLLDRLAKLKQADEPLDLGEYFSTHPPCGMRINHIRRYLETQSDGTPA